MEFISSIQSSGDYEGFKSDIKDLTTKMEDIEEEYGIFLDQKYPDEETPISQEDMAYIRELRSKKNRIQIEMLSILCRYETGKFLTIEQIDACSSWVLELNKTIEDIYKLGGKDYINLPNFVNTLKIYSEPINEIFSSTFFNFLQSKQNIFTESYEENIYIDFIKKIENNINGNKFVNTVNNIDKNSLKNENINTTEDLIKIKNTFNDLCDQIQNCPNIIKWFQNNLHDIIIPGPIIVLIILIIKGLSQTLSMFLYVDKVSGCYMFKNGKYIKLECGNYYKQSIENQLKCSCGKKISKIKNLNPHQDCNSITECEKPYCIGKCKNVSLNPPDSSICKINDNTALFQCTDVNIDDNNFINYIYKDYSPFQLYNNAINMKLKMFPPETKKNNYLVIILILVLIVISIVILLFFIRRVMNI